MYKKVYVEITNRCNLNCSFCNKNNRKKESISIDNFKIVLDKIKGYTKYIYLHVMGEPLLHPDVNKLIDIASNNYNVCITTNGYLIDKIKDNKNIYQLNISLHSYNPINKVSLDDYLNNMFNSLDSLLNNNTIVSLRMWTNTKYKEDIIEKLENRYNIKVNGNTKLSDNLFLEFETEFIWPNLNNNYYNECGSCQGLRTHIGILVDGTVIPCCLDSNGLLSLGNIYKNDLNEILSSKYVKDMIDNFRNNKKSEELCKHCNFYDRIIERKK